MSLVSSMPSLFRHPFFNTAWWDNDFSTPSRIFDQHFGLALRDDDLFPPTIFQGIYLRPRRAISRQTSGMSEVTNDSRQFKISLEVNHFLPEELIVKTVDDCILIEANHEERSDDHSYVSRRFCRRYYLPSSCKAEDVISELSSDNILTVTAPKKASASLPPVERIVPINRETKAAALPCSKTIDESTIQPTERIITVSCKSTPVSSKSNTVSVQLPSSPTPISAAPIVLPAPEPAVERIVPVVTEAAPTKETVPTPVATPAPVERIVPVTKEPPPANVSKPPQ